MSEVGCQTIYFSESGHVNTDRTLKIARQRMAQLNLRTVLVASTSGATGVKASAIFKGFEVIVVSHMTGFDEPDVQQMLAENRAAIEANGGRVLTCQHALGGVNRAVRLKFNTMQLDEIIAHTLRIFGQGMKVAMEMTLMATDAGLVRTDTPIMSIAGSESGADTAIVIMPSNSFRFFDLKVLEFVCLPSPYHPALRR